MFSVGKRVSFSVVVALMLGWGIFGLLILKASNELLQAQSYEFDHPIPIPPGIRLNVQVDKKVYRSGETALIALRNDSRLAVSLAEHADGCQGSWWKVESLGPDGVTWSSVRLAKDTCPTVKYGLQKFVRHTVKTAEWTAVVPTGQLGNIVQPAPTGTYRIAVPYLKGQAAQEAMLSTATTKVVSPSFTLQ